MKKNLYLFDFDGTISNKDSFIDFLFKSFGIWRVVFYIVINCHRIIYIRLRYKKKSKVKELLLAIFLKGKTQKEIIGIGNKYSEKYLSKIVRPTALEFIKNIRKEDADIYIVSASLDVWLYKFAKSLEVKLICTMLAYEKGIFTGFFKGKNCKGVEKVSRIKEVIDISKYNEIISYGDSEGDLEMFSIATTSFYKPFR